MTSTPLWIGQNAQRRSERSQKRKLLELVRFLAEALDRPVSSRDIDRYLKENPEQRPLLFKKYGQQLIGASRTYLSPVPRLYPIGSWNQAIYYAPDSSPHWQLIWKRYVAQEKLSIELKRPTVESLFYLNQGPLKDFAKNAARGWILEVEKEILPYLKFQETQQIQEQIAELQSIASPSYVAQAPLDLLDRESAKSLLTQESIKRRDRPLSFKRFLASLAWPTVSHFKADDSTKYSKKMIECFMVYKWPLGDDEPIFARTLFETLRFGTYGFFDKTTPLI